MDRVKHENLCRAVVVECFKKEAAKGSEVSMKTPDSVEGARLLLEGGGGGIAPAPVDARDQLMRMPLHVAAETHSARCIELLLSSYAHADVRVVDERAGRPLLPLEVALMSKRVQVQWSPHKSVEELLAFIKGRDLTAVRLLAEKTRVAEELAYGYAMEGCVPPLAMLLLVLQGKVLGLVSVVIEGIRTKRSIYNSIVDDALPMGDALPRDDILLCEIQLLNQFGSAAWRNQNDKRTLPPLLRAAKVGDMNVIKMLLIGNTALHWCLSGISRTQEPRIVWLLFKNGARVFQGNKLGLIAAHRAAATGNYKALQSLLLHEPDCVDIPSKTKETPLCFAVKNDSVDLILRFGADTKAQNLRKQGSIDLEICQDMPGPGTTNLFQSRPSKAKIGFLKRKVHDNKLTGLLLILLCTLLFGNIGKAVAASQKCDSGDLATQILGHCIVGAPAATCCFVLTAVMETGQQHPCICAVLKEDEMMQNKFTMDKVMKYYQDCHGKLPFALNLMKRCTSSPPPSTDEEPTDVVKGKIKIHPHHLATKWIIIIGLSAFVVFAVAFWYTFKCLKRSLAPQEEAQVAAEGVELQRLTHGRCEERHVQRKRKRIATLNLFKRARLPSEEINRSNIQAQRRVREEEMAYCPV